MKKLILAIIAMAFVTAGSAQDFKKYDENAGTYDRITKKGPYLTNKFFDNIFIGVGGGVSVYNGQGDGTASFSDRIAPALDISLGKWITPSVGLRVQVSGFWAEGMSPVPTPYTNSQLNSKEVYSKEFSYMNAHLDVLWNISNAIGGFRNDRTWSFIPYVGMGIGYSWDGDCNSTQFAGTVGLLNNIRLSNVVDLTLEGKYTMVKADFDKYVGSEKADGIFTATVGLSFKLGPKGGFKRPVAVAKADYAPYKTRIGNLEDDLASANSKIDKLAKDLEAARKVRPVETKPAVIAPVGMSVFFKIGQSFLSDKDIMNLDEIAKVIKATPNKVYKITGYADSSTGSAQLNEILSRQRAESVFNALVKNMGVDAKQLEIKSTGGVNIHQSKPELDRRTLVSIE